MILPNLVIEILVIMLLFCMSEIDGWVDALGFVAYHSTMTYDETNQPSTPDPLTTGELITLQQAAEYSGLAKSSLHNYAKQGRLRAKKIGIYWVTTKAAIDAYLKSRSLENIPKKYRDRA